MGESPTNKKNEHYPQHEDTTILIINWFYHELFFLLPTVYLFWSHCTTRVSRSIPALGTREYLVCVCVCTCRGPLFNTSSTQYSRVPQVGWHSVTASDWSSLCGYNSSAHELWPCHTVAVSAFRWVNCVMQTGSKAKGLKKVFNCLGFETKNYKFDFINKVPNLVEVGNHWTAHFHRKIGPVRHTTAAFVLKQIVKHIKTSKNKNYIWPSTGQHDDLRGIWPRTFWVAVYPG